MECVIGSCRYTRVVFHFIANPWNVDFSNVCITHCQRNLRSLSLLSTFTA